MTLRFAAFYLGLGLLFTHELDAMPNHEWRVVPGFSMLEDGIGQLAFVIAHVPIFALAIAFVASLNLRTRLIAQRVASGFLIVHAGLHLAFSGHDDYEFSTFLSSFLIYGAAACGLAWFLLPGQEIRHPEQQDDHASD